jgi:hypothetical protein
MSAFDTAQFSHLTTAQVHVLTTLQVSTLSTTQFASFTTDQLVAMTTTQSHAFTTDQIVAFVTDQIAGLTTTLISGMTTADYAAFESTDIAVMSDSQVNALLAVTPIVLDLSGTGIHTLAASDGVTFDVAGTGTAGKFGWIGDGNALLVRDINGDGVINNGKELYGLGTQLANGTRAGTGVAALAAEDTSHDGKITAADAHFKDMQLWVDTNHDGKSAASELHGLAEMGIVELDLNFTKGSGSDNGNLIGYVGSYVTADGQKHLMADVYFTKDTSGDAAPAASTPHLGELLSAPSADLLKSQNGTAASTTVAQTDSPNLQHTASLHRGLLDDEFHKNNMPLI